MKCKNCNKETNLWGNNYKKYCNIKCQREFEKNNKKINYNPIKCIICENVFIPKSYVNCCCSLKCKFKYGNLKISKKSKVKTCINCNKEYKPYTSLTKYCSANCRVENIKKKIQDIKQI